ncbi:MULTISPECIES: hypothetical protein [Listeriaceae]|uniref:Uncharacterized protein n=3 Tax=Listeria TaxID=1637 RepID=W7BCL0_9LIST|nr:hypothetical protein [Listeria]EUJ24824.1 hypothetical protein PGRAN_02995 [Listeria grandensis FSL F6-0971]MBC1436318.1 hypothetical protein [Listeria rocourtiae]MBC1603577.1 hypothetical protein [Listeria rocourtiae]MBC1935118.1 hypothetical protein [Listeria grandensis]TDR55136.1 hypothetical protein DFP96_10164 [Listeria rocourtiae]
MKKIAYSFFVVLSALVLTFGFVPQVNATEEAPGTNLPTSTEITYDVNKFLTEEEVSQRFIDIASKYELEEPFSKEDAEFVVRYSNTAVDALPPSNSMMASRSIHLYKGTQNRSFNKSKTAQGAKVTFSGKLTNHLNAINWTGQWYKGVTTAKINSGSAKVTKVKTVVQVSTYGLLGAGGTYVGLVNNSTISSESAKKGGGVTVNYLDKTKKYNAVLPVYSNVNAYVTVSTKTGSYNLYAF